MSRRSVGMSAAVLMLAAAVCAGAREPLLNVALQWKPTTEMKLGTWEGFDANARIEPFVDVRDDRTMIGENLEDKQPKLVTTSEDVGLFVSTHVRDLLGRAGVTTADKDAPVTVKGEVRQFFVKETSHYDSQVTVHLTVVDRNGNTLWTGISAGDAQHFGRSYKLENYEEGLSDAIVDMVSSMLRSEGFRKALSTR